MEGSGDSRFSLDFEEGPCQNQEIKKWWGPVVSGSVKTLMEDPARIRILKSGRVH